MEVALCENSVLIVEIDFRFRRIVYSDARFPAVSDFLRDP